MGIAVVAVIYSIAVLSLVTRMGDIGVRCVFGTDLQEEIPEGYEWRGGHPGVGDFLLAIEGRRIASYSDYIRALRDLGTKMNRLVVVSWRDHATDEVKTAEARVQNRPLSSYFWSIIWFVQ